MVLSSCIITLISYIFLLVRAYLFWSSLCFLAGASTLKQNTTLLPALLFYFVSCLISRCMFRSFLFKYEILISLEIIQPHRKKKKITSVFYFWSILPRQHGSGYLNRCFYQPWCKILWKKNGKQKGRNAIYFLRKTSRDSTERNEEEKKKNRFPVTHFIHTIMNVSWFCFKKKPWFCVLWKETHRNDPPLPLRPVIFIIIVDDPAVSCLVFIPSPLLKSIQKTLFDILECVLFFMALKIELYYLH